MTDNFSSPAPATLPASLTGTPVAAALGEELRQRIAQLATKGVTATLATIRLGEDPDDVYYEQSIRSACRRHNLGFQPIVFDVDVAEETVLQQILAINNDPLIDGLLLFQPLPARFNIDRLNDAIGLAKDVDGMSGANQGLVQIGRGGVAPCTAESVMRLLEFYKVPLSGARVTVVGRSAVIGRPVAARLLAANATVTICHSRTKDLRQAVSAAEIVVACLGKPRALDASYFRPGQVVIDVGYHEEADGVVGDVDFGPVAQIVTAITPARGGVGAITTVTLLEHVVTAAERRTS